jgi:hypothetical protein
MMAGAATNKNANTTFVAKSNTNELAGNNDLESNISVDPDYNSSLSSKTPKTFFVLCQE